MIRFKGLLSVASLVIAGGTLFASEFHTLGAAYDFKVINSDEVKRLLPAHIVIPDLESGDGVRRVSERSSFQSYDRFRLELQPQQSGHVYVFCRTSQGEFKLLYPQSGDGDNYVGRKETVRLPENGWFRFDEFPGQEELVVLESAAPLDMESDTQYELWTSGMHDGVLVRRMFLQHQDR